MPKKARIESRYARQILLKEWDQQKIRNGKVFIAGMGALGCVVAQNLVLMGIGKLIICDFDTIEKSNLSRQMLFLESDINMPKSTVAKNRLIKLNPDIDILAFNKKIQEISPKIYEECDVIVDGLDTFEARRWLNSISIDKKKPLVHGGMYGWLGNVQVVIPFKTACLDCQPLLPQERLQKPCTPPGKKRKKTKRVKKAPKIPSLLTISTIIGGIQAQEVIKLLLGVEKVLDRFLFYDGLSQTFTLMKLNRNPNCIVCGKNRISGVNFAVDPQDTIRDLKNRLIMIWDIKDPMKVIVKGVIRNDNVQLSKIGIQNKEPILIINKEMAKPLKIYAIIQEK
ncbi:MAG: HesA/MoeB/ThiF family protein [Candidatus Helarchaeota archaeon]|nr:HesA/MoeB/ThiF family protein [Candidatus Helarchaeota archaeon]